VAVSPTTREMLRREVRLRKEFLLKKEKDLQASQTISKKRLLQEALDSGHLEILSIVAPRFLSVHRSTNSN
jgi:hypothetical protein